MIRSSIVTEKTGEIIRILSHEALKAARALAGEVSSFGHGAERAIHTFLESDPKRKSPPEQRAQFVEQYKARQQIWHRDAPDDPARGHIDPYRLKGEPDLLRDNRHYEVVPLTFPRDGAEIFVEQRGWSDCHVIGAMNALEKAEPGILVAMVRQSGDMVTVRTHRGTYTMRPTLPHNPDGTEAFARGADGSTFAAYIEKAAAMHFGSYKAVQFGDAADVMRWAAGDRYATAHIRDIREMPIDEARAVLESGNPVAVNIVPPERPNDIPADLDRFNLNPKHVWAPVTLGTDGTLEMRNPVTAKGDSTGLTLEALHRMNASLHWVDNSG